MFRATLARTEGLAPTRLISITAHAFLAIEGMNCENGERLDDYILNSTSSQFIANIIISAQKFEHDLAPIIGT